MRLLCLFLAAGCSGAVSSPPATPPQTPLTVSPASATAYPGLPTTFTFSSSSAAVLVSSDNQAVIPSISATGTGFIVVPNPVSSDTLVHLTAQDASGSVTIPVTVKPIAVAPLSVQPGTINFLGLTPTSCAFGITADAVVFGGKPPYVVTQTPSFVTSAQVLSTNPATFKITAIGCATGDTLAVVDSLGNSASIKLTNGPSTLPTTPQPVLVVSPPSVVLTGCNDVATVALSGGSGSYFAASGNSNVFASVNGHLGYIQRLSGTASAPAAIQVAFSDGAAAIPVDVTLQGQATGKCPP